MPSIGDALRQRRVLGQQTASEAARASGVPEGLLIGFESGAVSLDDTQNLAYLRIYARYLGLDAEDLLRSLRYRDGRPPAADPDVGRRRVKRGARPADYGDTLTQGVQRFVSADPASLASAPSPEPEGVASPSSRPPRRRAALALLGAVIAGIAVAASVVMWDAVMAQSIVPAVPLAVVERTALEAAHHRG